MCPKLLHRTLQLRPHVINKSSNTTIHNNDILYSTEPGTRKLSQMMKIYDTGLTIYCHDSQLASLIYINSGKSV